jgi:hypothetical protein
VKTPLLLNPELAPAFTEVDEWIRVRLSSDKTSTETSIADGGQAV